MYGTDMHTGTSTSTVVHTVRRPLVYAGAAGHVRDFPGISRVGLPVAVWPEDDASPPAGLSSLQWHDGVAPGRVAQGRAQGRAPGLPGWVALCTSTRAGLRAVRALQQHPRKELSSQVEALVTLICHRR